MTLPTPSIPLTTAAAIVASSDTAVVASEELLQLPLALETVALETVASAAEPAPANHTVTTTPESAGNATPEPAVERLDPATIKAQIAANLQHIGSDDDDEVPTAGDLPPAELRGALEAVLLVATKPLSSEKIANLLPGTAISYLEGFLTGLAERASSEGRGWMISRIAGGWQLLTRPAFHPWVRQLDKKELPSKLSRSAMETLAIIAYKQPISRGQIDDIRGVQSSPMVRQLMDLKLVQVAGRSEELLGKPLLYSTTAAFCDRFGLASADDLPKPYELST